MSERAIRVVVLVAPTYIPCLAHPGAVGPLGIHDSRQVRDVGSGAVRFPLLLLAGVEVRHQPYPVPGAAPGGVDTRTGRPGAEAPEAAGPPDSVHPILLLAFFSAEPSDETSALIRSARCPNGSCG